MKTIDVEFAIGWTDGTWETKVHAVPLHIVDGSYNFRGALLKWADAHLPQLYNKSISFFAVYCIVGE